MPSYLRTFLLLGVALFYSQNLIADFQSDFRIFFKKFYSLVAEQSEEAKKHIRFPLEVIGHDPVEETRERVFIKGPSKLKLSEILGGNGTEKEPKFKFKKNRVRVTIDYTNSEFGYDWDFTLIDGQWYLVSVTVIVY